MIRSSKQHLLATVSIASVCILSALGQGTFQNLDFEGAQLPFPPNPVGGYMSVSNALPWGNAFIDGSQRDAMVYNGLSGGGLGASSARICVAETPRLRRTRDRISCSGRELDDRGFGGLRTALLLPLD